VKHFLQKSGAVRSVDGIFITGAAVLVATAVVAAAAAPVPHFSSSQSLRKLLLEI
jgi:hypothetical protein